MITNLEYAKQFSKIPINQWTNREFLALIAEYWNANHYQMQSIQKILYIFWIKPDGRKLKTHLGIFMEVEGDILIPHIIYDKIPVIDQPNTVVYIFTPSSLKSKNLAGVMLESNLIGLSKEEYSIFISRIIQVMSHVYKRMKEGFKGTYSESIVKMDKESKFYKEPTITKRKPSIDGKYEIPNYVYADKMYPVNTYFTPKNNLIISVDKTDYLRLFRGFDENLRIVILDGIEDFNSKGMRLNGNMKHFTAEMIAIKLQGGIDKIDLNLNSKFLKIFQQIILEEPEFHEDITFYEVIKPAIILSEIICNMIPKDRKKYESNINLLMVYGVINPFLSKPTLTMKGLIYRRILGLSGFTNMLLFTQLPLFKYLPEVNHKFKDAEEMKFGSMRDRK